MSNCLVSVSKVRMCVCVSVLARAIFRVSNKWESGIGFTNSWNVGAIDLFF